MIRQAFPGLICGNFQVVERVPGKIGYSFAFKEYPFKVVLLILSQNS
jgi:hypothetical protein